MKIRKPWIAEEHRLAWFGFHKPIRIFAFPPFAASLCLTRSFSFAGHAGHGTKKSIIQLVILGQKCLNQGANIKWSNGYRKKMTSHTSNSQTSTTRTHLKWMGPQNSVGVLNVNNSQWQLLQWLGDLSFSTKRIPDFSGKKTHEQKSVSILPSSANMMLRENSFQQHLFFSCGCYVSISTISLPASSAVDFRPVSSWFSEPDMHTELEDTFIWFGKWRQLSA